MEGSKRATVIIDKKTKQLVSADVKLQVSEIDQTNLNKAIQDLRKLTRNETIHLKRWYGPCILVQ
ncbi:hypothetical protein C0R09_17735 [Brevibacillus laterosporus]|nr:hypothetical protein C0R09_17735 [Brevibacillus laterosporus]